MRRLIFVAMIVSAMVGVFYPAWISETSDETVASRPIFKLSDGFRDASVELDVKNGPVRLFVEADVTLPMDGAHELRLYAFHKDLPVLVSTAKFPDSAQRWRSKDETSISAFAGAFVFPQTGTYTFRAALVGSSGRALDRVKLLIKPATSPALLHELTIFDRADAFVPAEVDLDAKTKLLLVSLEASATRAGFGETEILLRSTADSQQAFASTVKFSTTAGGSQPHQPARMIGSYGFLQVEKPGTYRFEAALNGKDGIRFEQIDLVLRSGAKTADRRVTTIAFGLAALLLVLFHFSQYLPGQNQAAVSEFPPQGRPAPPKWGRGAAKK